MNYKRLCHNRICRVLICLALICCLFVNIAFIPKAHASGLAGTLYQIAGNIGVNAALRAIGVGPGNSPDAFNTLVTNISDALAPASNFMTDVLIAGTSGNWLTFFRDTFLQSILDYMFDSGTLTSGFTTTPPYKYGSMTLDEALALARTYPYAYRLDFSSTSYGLMVGTAPITFGTSYPVGWSSKEPVYIFSASTSKWTTGDTAGSQYIDYSKIVSIGGNSSVVTSEDLILDAVAPSLDDDPYFSWVENSIFNDGETFFPVSFPSTDSSVVSSQTQTQAQAGTASDAVVDEIIAGSEVVPDTGTGTIAEVIAAIKALPQSIAEIFTDVIAGIKALPQTISDALVKAFAISDTFIATKVESLTLKYPYLDIFLALGTDLKAYFLSLGSKPPIIYLDLGAADGLIPWGDERVKFLDLTWYSAYKPVMDSILGGFLWLWLAWRIFLTIPGLINGTSGVAGRMISFNVVSSKKDGGDNG